MQLRKKTIVAFAVAVLALGVSWSSALAQGGPPTGTPPSGAPAGKPGGKHGQGGVLKSAAEYLGMTVEQLRAELKGGKSLAQVAAATPGKSADGLKAAILADAKSHLDAAVAAGKLTAEKAQAAYSKLQSKVDEIVNKTGKPGGSGGKGAGKAAQRGVMKSAAAYLGLTPQELKEKVKAGQSLAQIAAATPGKSVDGLKQAIVADAKTVIDKLVAEGKISAERGQQYLAQIQSSIDQIVNRTGPGK